MRRVAIYTILALAQLAFAQQPGRSIVGQVILPGPPHESSDSTTVALVRVLNNTLAQARAECGTYESVYWSGRILTPSVAAIKQDVIGQLTNRRWTYTVFDRSTDSEMFHIVSPDESQLIVGGWVYLNSALTLTWCYARSF